jgi:hypothetical protein
MKLLQLCAAQIRLNQPLPWNVRTQPGELLLGKGQLVSSQRQLDALLERGMFVDEGEYERYRREHAAGAAPDDPFYVWSDLVRKTAALLRDPASVPQFVEHTRALAQQLNEAVLRDPDIGGFELAHMDRVGYPVLHSLQTAYVSSLVARRLQLSEGDTSSLLCAALTMNLSMLELQTLLCRQRYPPTEDQRAQIRSHPARSADLLRQAGVDDDAWLRAVREHHERNDGTGYPSGTGEVSSLALVVQHCDVYLAKLASRQTRPAMPVHEAARSFFLQRGGAVNPIAAAIIKEMGIYPPGAYVKLANGETAVVVRRGESANAPQVVSLSNAQGIPFAEPLRRDTRVERFRVLAPVAAGAVMVRVDRGRLFGVAA